MTTSRAEKMPILSIEDVQKYADEEKKSLNLHGFFLTSNDISQYVLPFLKQNPHISDVTLSWNYIDDEGAIALSKLNTIKILNLAHNDIGSKGIEAFSNNTSIEKLDVGHNTRVIRDGKSVPHPQGAMNKAVEKLASTNKMIKWLGVNSLGIGKEAVSAILNNKKIEEANLQFNNIEPQQLNQCISSEKLKKFTAISSEFGYFCEKDGKFKNLVLDQKEKVPSITSQRRQ